MFLLIVAAIVSIFVWGYLKFSEVVASVSHIPGPKPVPFLGNGLMFVGKNSTEIHESIKRNHEKFGLTFCVFLGPKVQIILIDPKDVETLLTDQKSLQKSEEYDITSSWIGTGLLTASKDKWPARRKVTTPGFHFRCLQEFVKVFEKNSEILVEKIRETKGETFDAFPLVQLCALDNICGELRLFKKMHLIIKLKQKPHWDRN
jgi:cytochrome P450 family 4